MNSIGQTVFELESGNENVDGQTDGQMDKNGQTNKQNYTNFERNLVIYVPVKFEFDWTNCFRVRVQKQKCGQTDGQTNGQKTDKRMDGISPISKGT